MKVVTYPSKQDRWVILVVAGSAILVAIAGIAVVTATVDRATRLILTGLFAAETMFIVNLMLRTDYTLQQDHLQIRCGVIR